MGENNLLGDWSASISNHHFDTCLVRKLFGLIMYLQDKGILNFEDIDRPIYIIRQYKPESKIRIAPDMKVPVWGIG